MRFSTWSSESVGSKSGSVGSVGDTLTSVGDTLATIGDTFESVVDTFEWTLSQDSPTPQTVPGSARKCPRYLRTVAYSPESESATRPRLSPTLFYLSVIPPKVSPTLLTHSPTLRTVGDTFGDIRADALPTQLGQMYLLPTHGRIDGFGFRVGVRCGLGSFARHAN